MVPVAVAATIFAVMNRAPVELDLWPLPWRIQAAAYLILLGSLVIGLLIGLLLAWFAGGARRKRLRQYTHANERQASEIRDLRKQLAEARRSAAETAPVVLPAPLPGAATPSVLPAPRPAYGPEQE